MDTKNEKKPPVKKYESEVLVALFLIIISIFSLVLTFVLIVRSMPAPTSNPQQTEITTEETTEDPDSPEGPSAPLFSGGVLPAPPQVTENTKNITEGLAAGYAILMNAQTGEIVASLNSQTVFSPASMAKVMTLIVACEELTEDALDEKLTMTEEWYNYSRANGYLNSSLHGIDLRDEYTVRDLLYGIGMKSASDCVVPIVFHVAGSEEAFVAKMNQKAKDLNLKNTQFDNAIGYDSPNTYTTAEDMAVIMSYAMQSTLIRDILGKVAHTGQAAGYNSKGEYVPSYDIHFYSSLLGPQEGSRLHAYEEVYGKFTLSTAKLLSGKTGYTDDNYCLVANARANSDGSEYILVVAKADQKHETLKDVKTILDAYVK